VHIPTAELTQNAVRWLLNQCYRTTWEIFREFPVSVTMRESVGPAPGVTAAAIEAARLSRTT
jgi:LacI family transcriptional regulator